MGNCLTAKRGGTVFCSFGEQRVWRGRGADEPRGSEATEAKEATAQAGMGDEGDLGRRFSRPLRPGG